MSMILYENFRATAFNFSETDIHEFAYAVRKHWSIENQLHWCLDVIFREDAARARKNNSPLNINFLSKCCCPGHFLYFSPHYDKKRTVPSQLIRGRDGSLLICLIEKISIKKQP